MEQKQHGDWLVIGGGLLRGTDANGDGLVSAGEGDPGIGFAGLQKKRFGGSGSCGKLFAEGEPFEDGVIGFLESISAECFGDGCGGFQSCGDEVPSEGLG
jgi:hypothetical protein